VVAVASVGFGFTSGVIQAGGIANASMDGNTSGNVKVTVYKGFKFSDATDSDFSVIVNC